MKTLLRLYRSVALLFFCTAAAEAEVREAVAYLEREVPKWYRENGCYSCHNNGDGLRALLLARRLGVAVDSKILEASVLALRSPREWEIKPLARLQFAAAVQEAEAARLVTRDSLTKAAEAVATDQHADGHWKVEDELAAGSPVTWGPVLATYLGRQILAGADHDRHAARIARATGWLEQRKPQHILETAVLALALRREADVSALLTRQSIDGSWDGEPFDTAWALLAVNASSSQPAAADKARAWLLKTQWSGGGWPATTRPAGGDSYAQHISTTAWVLISLALTEPAR